ncbi:MAG: UPF0158 family protein [Geobacteraceae bacterium]
MLMEIMRDMEIVWDDLIDAFENTDPELVYFLDRHTGEVFLLSLDHGGAPFWEEMQSDSSHYLSIPGFDYEQERLILHEFIKGVKSVNLRQVLERSFTGKLPYGRLDEILSFYPDEMEQLEALRETLTADRIRRWLEENDIFPPDTPQVG